MSIQFSVNVRNAMLDAVETAIGTAAVLQIKSGSVPAATTTANSGTVLVSYTLASDWAAAAASGSKSFNNTPLSANAAATGTAGHFRIFSSTGTCHWQGTVATSAADLTIDNTSVNSGQTVNVTSFTLSMANS
jgi:hypothetical protein